MINQIYKYYFFLAVLILFGSQYLMAPETWKAAAFGYGAFSINMFLLVSGSVWVLRVLNSKGENKGVGGRKIFFATLGLLFKLSFLGAVLYYGLAVFSFNPYVLVAGAFLSLLQMAAVIYLVIFFQKSENLVTNSQTN